MTPDQWSKLINSDPIWQQLTSSLGANEASTAAQRNAGIEQALAAFGGPVNVNDIAQKLGLSPNDLQGLDSNEIQQLAREADQSGVSTNARLNAANQKAVMQLKNALNARGLLRSGEAAYQLGQQAQNYQNAQFDARQKLLSTLQQYQQGYLAAKAQLAAQLAQGGNDAFSRMLSLYGGMGQAQGPQEPAAPAPAPAPPPPQEAPPVYFNPETGQLQSRPPAPTAGQVWAT